MSADASAEQRIDPGEWDAVIPEVAGPQLVVAGPGAGKTEFLVRRALHLIEETAVDPSGVLLLTFSRRGSSDLRRRVETGLDRSFTAPAAATFHSLAHRLLERHAAEAFGWDEMPALLTGPEQVALVHELLAEEDPAAWAVPYRGLLSTQTFAGEVTDFILRCQEQLVDAADLAERARADWRGLPAFFDRYLAALERRRRIDYGTLQAQAVRLLGDETVAADVSEQHRFILVDEYQDTTVAQSAMLQRLYRVHRNLTVAGDPYQSIYSFRGAELGNVHAFPAQFPDAAGDPARRVVLTTSFRVPRVILDAAVRITAHGHLPGGAGPVQAAPGKGAVETYGFEQASQEASWIAAELQRAHLGEGIPYRNMAVLVRSKRRFLPELSRALDRRRIPHDRPDARLIDQPAVRLVLDCVVAATAAAPESHLALRRLLLGPLFALPLGALRDLQRAAARSDAGWPSLLRERLDRGDELAELLEETDWATALPAADGFWRLWTSLPHLPRLVADPERQEDRAAWSSFSQVLHRLRDRDPSVTLADYLLLSEDEEFEATPLLEFQAADADRLTLTTLHQAKGLDFELVFIADAIEGVFPDLRPRESLLGSRHLSPSQPSDPAGYAGFRLQEEMRLAYTAMTRARRRVVWTATSSGSEEGEGAPSRFLALVTGRATVGDAAGPPPVDTREVVTPLEAEAWLRRRLRDPALGEMARLAAAAVLARGPRWGLRPPHEFAGVRRRGPDRGLISSRFSLSPSQVQSYLECPRRYAFERRLDIGARTSIHMAFGTLIHNVLEIAETRTAAGGTPATIDDALAILEELWDPVTFGRGAWAEAWHRRATAALEQLYEHRPESAVPVLVEHDLRLELDGVEWRGRADLIERDSTGLRVVDYKTSRSAVTQREAAISMQLGFYFLAAGADADIRRHGEVVGAEFWYPAAPTTTKLTTRSLDPNRIDEVRQSMRVAGAGIAAERWDPQTNERCERCEVRLVCPAWPEGREAFSW